MAGVIGIALVLLGSLYALWLFFLACMNLKRAKEAGQLSRTALVLGTPLLWVGYTLDAFVNTTLMTIVLLEWPQWQLSPPEILVTDRLKRHHQTSTGWRLAVVLWFEPLLDPYDPSGDHV
jgi:hypothetical protein